MSQSDRPGMNQMASFAPAVQEYVKCAFPAAPVRRRYCHPAAFTSFDGNRFQKLSVAYGASIPDTMMQ